MNCKQSRFDRNVIYKQVKTLLIDLYGEANYKPEIVKYNKYNKHDLKNAFDELTILKNARTVDCAAVDEAIVDEVIVDNDIAEYDADYTMMKQYFKRNRDAALLSK